MYAERFPEVRFGLERWRQVTLHANWHGPDDIRKTGFAAVDFLRMESGRTLVVFNIGVRFRLLTAVHYDTGSVSVLRVLSYNEYVTK
jgi:mRNA-degrading endonuclease HigB of HigAB toxin-antitoxin module